MKESRNVNMAIPPQSVMVAVLMMMLHFSGSESAACSPSVVHMSVSTPDQAQELVSALNCTGGGEFNVSWSGTVAISQAFVVPRNSSLTITGAAGISPAGGNELDVVDAEGITTIIRITDVIDKDPTFKRSPSGGSSLILASLILTGGQVGDGGYMVGSGGAVQAFGSDISNSNCTFRNNSSSSSEGEQG